MSKKKSLFIGLQVLAIAVFVGMALACKSNEAVAEGKTLERSERGACGNPDYVFIGEQGNLAACTSACHSAGLGSPCYANGNCFCK